jgi:hypothetical protein
MPCLFTFAGVPQKAKSMIRPQEETVLDRRRVISHALVGPPSFWFTMDLVKRSPPTWLPACHALLKFYLSAGIMPHGVMS